MGDYSDDGYDLPPLKVYRHFAKVDIVDGRNDGQLFRQPELSATSIHRESRRTSEERAALVRDIVAAEPGVPWVVWVETNYDADAVKEVLPGAVDVRGSMSPEEKARRLLAFTDEGGIVLTKPGIAGMGLNWQHCARMVFNGLSFSYERYYQAIRRSSPSLADLIEPPRHLRDERCRHDIADTGQGTTHIDNIITDRPE